MLHTTRNLLHKHEACRDGYRKLIKTIGSDYHGDKPISLLTVLESNGLNDALWCLQAALPEQEKTRDRIARLMTCDFAENVLPIFEKERPDDNRPRQAIMTMRQLVDGNATQEELTAARDAASAAAWAARDAARAAWAESAAESAAASAAASAAWAARDAAGVAAWAAVSDAESAAASAAESAAASAASAAWAESDAASAAAWAARDAARAFQEKILRQYLAGDT